MAKYWIYEKMDENYRPCLLPINDIDGKITGKVIIDLKSYFDENPEIRKSLGWIKHIKTPHEDLKEYYDPQTQNLVSSIKKVDDFTVEDIYYSVDKSEEQLLYEELGFRTGGMLLFE